jgi:predicted ATPase
LPSDASGSGPRSGNCWSAARVPLQGVEGVRSRLDERFQLLSADNRIGLRRHQTLRAALELRHSHLSETEQIVFRRAALQQQCETAARLSG